MFKKTFVTITSFMMIMSFTFTFLPGAFAAPVTIFEDDMELGISNWTSDGLWHQTDDRYNSFNTSWVYNDGADYDTGARTFGNLTSSEIDLTTVESANLTFWTWHETEGNPNYDKIDRDTFHKPPSFVYERVLFFIVRDFSKKSSTGSNK